MDNRLESTPSDKIAIIGIGCLFPGANTPDQFWRNLSSGLNTTSAATAARMGVNPAFFFNPGHDGVDTSYLLHGGYIHDFHFDPDGFELPTEYLAGLGDPFQWALYVARAALEDSGSLDNADLRARCGVILGNLSFPTRHSNALFTPVYQEALQTAISDLLGRDVLLSNGPVHPNALDNALSGGQPAAVVAHALGLGAGSFALDAACASSLYAVGLACKYLNAGKADLMLAGAVSAADPLFVNLGFAHLGAYPGDERGSRPLDATSEGLISGEGAGMFVLKRLSDALRDGDRVYAVVSGVGMTNDGRGKHILTPNSKGQVMALEAAYHDAGLIAGDVQYVECHASGTPVGDKTELTSMEIFFGQRDVRDAALFGSLLPRIGSVKSNVGHLLTAAGMASMLKVILAMHNSLIPATLGVKQPLTSQAGTFSGTQIIAEHHAWTDERKRAGVNAFGFGGVSAHLILESSERQHMQTTQSPRPPAKMAVIGMDAHFGPLDGLDAFARAIYDGQTAFTPLPADRWRGLQNQPQLLERLGLPGGQPPHGAYIGSFELDFLKYKIPPNPGDEPIPQQLLLLKVADNALRDAGLPEGGKVAVIVALGTELALHALRGRADLNWQIKDALANAGLSLTPGQTAELERISKDSLLSLAEVNHYTSYIGNITASRVSSLWDFSGPAFTVSAEENSVFKALEVAQLLLTGGDVDAVVLGAVDLAGSIENVLMRAQRAPLASDSIKASATFDENADGWQVGEGAGALVLVRAAEAPANKTYATIDAVALATNAAAAAHQAHRLADIIPADVEYLEMHASGIPDEDTAELEALAAVYQGGADLTTAVGSIKANIGHTYAASGMASLIKTVLVTAQRFLPAVPNWKAPRLPHFWEGTPFWVPTRSRAWFSDRRAAAVSGLAADGSAAHVIVSAVGTCARDNGYLKHGSPYLLLLAGMNAADITQGLDDVSRHLESAGDAGLPALADRVYAAYAARHDAPYTLALVGRDVKELAQEIDRARQAVPQTFTNGANWSTPAGSAFSARPVGADGGVAFVYPGAFNTYPKMGYDLFHLFPHIYDTLRAVKSNVGEAVAERLLYPRSVEKPGPKLTNAMKTALGDNAVAMIESGLSFALMYTRIMEDTFGLHPQAAFGYSLGEGSMIWGMGIWRDGDAGSAAFHESPLFTQRLAGPMDSVREAWGIPAHIAPDDFWAAYFIAAPVERVRAAIAAENQVYLTHVNTPHEVMIAGDPAACQRIVEAVQGDSMRAPFSVVIHNEVMLSEFNEFRRLYDLPVHPVSGVTFYSAADYAPLKLERGVIANNIARMTCKQIDFPRLIERAYNDGARVFIELGPRSTCARWISETLGHQPHLAVSIDTLGADDRVSIIKMLAQLTAHRVPLDLSPLYAPVRQENGRSLVRTVRLGGQDIYAAIVNAPNQAKFAGTASTPAPAVKAPAHSAAPQTPVQQSPLPAVTPPATAVNAAHLAFLETRRDALRQLAEVVEMSLSTLGQGAPAAPPPAAPVKAAHTPPPPHPAPPPSVVQGITPLYSDVAVRQFATGRVADCFGERYAIYDNRRAPRIPNGDLLLITRAVDIQGERYKLDPGTSIHAEYDVPVNEWFYRDNPYPVMPYSVYMEIALQPSGFLSAHHGPTLQYPDIDFYFRNLDGQGRLYKDIDMRGRTITNHVRMLSFTAMQGIIIQKFDFKMFDGDLLFYEGDATFGYFTKEALKSQAGLDAGKLVPRWIDTVNLTPSQVRTIDPRQPFGDGYLRLANGQLQFTDEIKVVPGGGTYGQGYAYAHTIIDPASWFFFCHFYQDPVMPGSIGVETIMQALQAYAIETGLGAGFKNPRFAQADAVNTGGQGHNIVWRYRGQILSDSDKSHIEANIKRIERRPDSVVIYADASLWRDKLRIYEVKDIALAIVEG